MEIPGRRRRRKVKSRSGSSRRDRRWAWWCWGDNLKNKRVALGPWDSETEAQSRGLQGYPGEFKAYYLDTIHMPTAKQKLKAKDLEDGRSIDEVMNRASSELP